ncbi:MAG: hypothetical protein Q4G22_15415 [Paracoccus sp. (in: a-proteobacteria)]|uniref:hypothetical protein n=1 Tax=Paracoccus sp. TaxID=267 RepID=UPI0026E027DD|nr:hypothetical protein [Paracoccus sp. (in: a-proteobacteria)]MDO5633200.1 hypothetical protein [Paracoccus sp. (in: a-proteobacteria)]
MTRMMPEEKRALDQEEQELSQAARQPNLARLSDSDLNDLIRRLRDRRDRARDIASRQRREARGKAAPRGNSPARDNAGTKTKHDYLSAALRRAGAEQKKRRDGGASGKDQAALARKAADLKAAAEERNSMKEDGGPLHPRDPDADKGMKNMKETAHIKYPSGAFEHAGEKPARERSGHRG